MIRFSRSGTFMLLVPVLLAFARLRAGGPVLVAGQGLQTRIPLERLPGEQSSRVHILGRTLSERVVAAGQEFRHLFTGGEERILVMGAQPPDSKWPSPFLSIQEIRVRIRGLWRFSGAADGQPGSGDGAWSTARFRQPCGIAALPPAGGDGWTGESWLVADAGEHTVRLVDATGTASTPWGRASEPGCRDGRGAEARLNGPTHLALHPGREGGWVRAAVADSGNHVIRTLTPGGEVSLLAGTPEHAGFLDAAGGAPAAFSNPQGLAYDPQGNLYVADQGNRRIRRIAPDGTVTTVAGTGAEGALDGPGREASFTRLAGLAMDARGWLYVADGHAIRRIEPGPDYRVTTLVGCVDQPGRSDDVLSTEQGVEREPDKLRRALRLAGQPLLKEPRGLAVVGARLLIADAGNGAVREFDTARGNLRTVAGRPSLLNNREGLLHDGLEGPLWPEYAALERPLAVAADRNQDLLASSGAALWKLGRAEGLHGAGEVLPVPVTAEVTGLRAGSPILRVRVRPQDIHAQFREPRPGLAIKIMVVRVDGGPCSSHSADRAVLEDHCEWSLPLSEGATRGLVFLRVLTDTGVTLGGSAVWRVTDRPGAALPDPAPPLTLDQLRKQARQPDPSQHLDEGVVVPVGAPAAVAWRIHPGATRQLLATRSLGSFTEGGQLRGLEVSGGQYGPRIWPGRLREFRLDSFLPPAGPDGLWTKVRAYHRIHRRGAVRLAGGLDQPCGVLATPGPGWGDDDASAAPAPSWLVVEPGSHVVRERFRDPGEVGRVWGQPGSPGAEDGAQARLCRPSWLAAAPDPDTGRIRVVLADSGNHALRLLHPDGSVTTFAGAAGSPGLRDGWACAGGVRLRDPQGLAFDPEGNLWVADAGNRVIRRVDQDGTVTTVAGSGAAGRQDGRGAAATFTGPKGLAVAWGKVFVTDGHALRRVDPDGTVTTVLGAVHRSGAAGPGSLGRGGLPAPGEPCLDDPQGLAFDGVDLLIADHGNHCLRAFNPGRQRFGILAGDRAQAEFRPGLLRDGVPGPLPAECAALGRPLGLCCAPDRDLTVTAGPDLVEVGRAAALVAPGPGGPVPFEVKPAPGQEERKDGPASRGWRVSWDLERLSGGGDAFRDARYTVECRDARGDLESLSAGPLEVSRGAASVALFLPAPGLKRILLRLQTAQGVLLGGEQSVRVR